MWFPDFSINNNISPWFLITALTDEPKFAEPIPNVTVALGRDAALPCVVENLGEYKVIIIKFSYLICAINFVLSQQYSNYF